MGNKMALNCLDIEIAIAGRFSPRQNVIVPNLSWGLGLRHEIDVAVVSPKSRYLREIEIKTSKSDLVRDKEKRHGHRSNLVRELFFAVPEALREVALTETPPHSGVMVVSEDEFGDRWTTLIRAAKVNKEAKPLSEPQMCHLYHLAAMRIWTLKKKCSELYREIKRLKK